MASGISHAIIILICELNDKEKDACKGKEESSLEKECGRDAEYQQCTAHAVYLPEVHRP